MGAFITKRNDYDNKIYKIMLLNYDTSRSEFDSKLHNNDITPMINDCQPTTCMYCMTTFDSRNKLFNHLGFMNIDTRNENRTDSTDLFTKKKRHKYRYKKHRTRGIRKQIQTKKYQKEERYKERYNYENLLSIMQNIKI